MEYISKIDEEIKKLSTIEQSGDVDIAIVKFKALHKKAVKYGYTLGQGHILIKLAGIYRRKAEVNIAIEYCTQAFLIYESLENKVGMASVYNEFGSCYTHLGAYQKALEYYFRLIEIAEHLRLRDVYIMIAKVNIGHTYMQMNFTDRALSYFKESLTMSNKLNNLGTALVNLSNIGVIYFKHLQYKKALYYFKRGLNIAKKVNNQYEVAITLCNIAGCYSKLEEFDKAMRYYRKAIKQSINTQNTRTQALALMNLANIYIGAKDYTKAKKAINEIENTIDITQDITLHIDYLRYVIKLCKETGDFQNAVKYYEVYSEIREKIFSEENLKRVASLEADFEIKQKEKEAEIYRLKNVELVQLNNELEDANTRLIKIDESKDAILRIVSHDLKNLIGTTLQRIEMIRFQPLNEKVAKHIDAIDINTKRAVQLVKDILEANEIETDGYKLELSPVKIDDFLEKMVDSFIPACEQKKINFITQFNADNIVVNINPDKMWQILNNLIHNAIKFTPREGSITLCTTPIPPSERGNDERGDFIYIKVKDTGVGIPPEYIPILFEKFTKAKRKGTEGENATGIGLSIVKRLVELHEGEITVTSEIDKGTEFCIRLVISE